jgi:hypothetical protein
MGRAEFIDDMGDDPTGERSTASSEGGTELKHRRLMKQALGERGHSTTALRNRRRIP